jgi:peptide/nickel transport system substrate-binding protein
MQWRSTVQAEPTNFDPRQRRALYHAIDREALTVRELPAWSLLPPGDQHYEAVKDGFRPFAYDPDRSKALLREVGWTAGSDGVLRHSSDGRRLKNAIYTTIGARHWEMSVYGDYWRRIGVEVEEYTIPSSQVRNLEFRAHFPNWEASSAGQGDAILGRLDGPAASAQNRWVGERGGYDDSRAQELIRRYRTSLSEREQAQAMRALSDFVAAELPLLAFYYTVDLLGARRGIRALDDVEGGAVPAAPPFGTYTRNAHLWDVE